MKLKDNSLFKRLLTVLTTIDHPYAEKFLGAYIEGQKIFLVTDRQGQNLASVFNNINPSDAFSLKPGDRTILAFKIAQAMSYLHSRSVVHRNLVSSNIFVTRKNDEITPMVVGFRNSRLIDENSIGLSSLSIQSKMPISYFYAPELEDGMYDDKVDVFAFSAILYQMLTGSQPFPQTTRLTVLNLLSKEVRPPLPEDKDAKEINNLIESCWK